MARIIVSGKRRFQQHSPALESLEARVQPGSILSSMGLEATAMAAPWIDLTDTAAFMHSIQRPRHAEGASTTSAETTANESDATPVQQFAPANAARTFISVMRGISAPGATLPHVTDLALLSDPLISDVLGRSAQPKQETSRVGPSPAPTSPARDDSVAFVDAVGVNPASDPLLNPNFTRTPPGVIPAIPRPGNEGDTRGGPNVRWTKQAPLPTSTDILGIAVLSPTEIWAAASPLCCGGEEVLVHTTNAGTTWQTVALGAGTSPKAVFFVDPQHGWVVGNAFLHTTDGGKTWSKDYVGGSVYDVFFLDTQNGWAAGNGGVAYRTTNGGVDWDYALTGTNATLSSIWFTDQTNGWTVSIDGEIFRTTNGGANWTLNTDLPNAYLSTIQFLDPLEGWAIGGDDFYHTLNGGQSWTKSFVPGGTWSHGARFYDRLNGISVGEYGNITRTDDGGATWITISPIGSGPRLWDVEYGNAITVFNSGEIGALSRSNDSGQTWVTMQSGGAGSTHAIDILDAQRAWAANDGGEVLSTVNGGKKWVRNAVTGFDVYGQINDVDFVDASTGWVVGTNATFGPDFGRVARTTDGGQTWELQLNEIWVHFLGVSALSTTTALAYGRDIDFGVAVLRRTTDGGASWSEVLSTNGSISGGFFLDAMTGWVVGTHIWKTTDGGATFVKQYHNSSGDELYAVSFSDAQHGWAVGYDNQVLRTTNGGQTWTPQTISAPPLTAFVGVTAVSSTTAWVSGGKGTVAGTTDGGQTWIKEAIPGGSGAYFEAAEFIDANTGWVAGDAGIFKRERRRG